MQGFYLAHIFVLWTFPEQVHVYEDKLPGVEVSGAAGGHHELPDDPGGGAHGDDTGPGGGLPQQTSEHGGIGGLLIEGDVGDVVILDAAHVP